MDVGIRALKERTSAVIRRVTAGETVKVTDRGRTVAQIVPLRDGQGAWDRLVSDGRVIPAKRDLAQVLAEMPPAPLAPGEGSPLQALTELRADER